MGLVATAIIAQYEMDDPNVDDDLVDASGNGISAPYTGAAGHEPQPIWGFGPNGYGVDWAREFGLDGSQSSYQGALGAPVHHEALIVEACILVTALPAGSVQALAAALLDAGGAVVLGIGVNPDGRAVLTYPGGSVTSTDPIFPQPNWVHVVARYAQGAGGVELDVAVVPGKVPVNVGIGNAGGADALPDATSTSVHPSAAGGGALAVDHVLFRAGAVLDGPFSTAAPVNTWPGCAGMTMTVRPLSSAGCSATLSLQPNARDPFGLDDPLNPANWVASASEGTVPTVALVDTPGAEVGASSGFQFDLTFEIPLSPGVQYQISEMLLEANGNNPGIPAGTLLQATQASFESLRAAVQPASVADLVYGVDIANPPFVGDYQIAGTGDYANESGLAALKKRILRRWETSPNGFSSLPGYGVGVPALIKQLQTPARRRVLLERLRRQTLLEPGVSSLTVTPTQLPDGFWRIMAKVETALGTLSISYPPALVS